MPEDTTIVIGLGNPGWEYEHSRHNLGFMVVDELCRRLKKDLGPGKGEYAFTHCIVSGREIQLVKPLTYMNNSGIAVVDVLELAGGSPGNLLVISDDFALPLGTLRLRTSGSDGGHNGLYSVIYHLGTEDFPRLRCGIGKELMPLKSERADFVLSPFDEDERAAATAMVSRAADAVIECVTSGIDRAMNIVNT